MDCRLWTADCGQRIQSPRLREKNSSAHISIFQRFLKFPVTKREMSNSSSLNLAIPCCACQAWPLRGWGRGKGEGGKSQLKVTTGMFVALLGEEIVGFGCSMFLPIWVSPMVVRKEILS